jgi:hypothetical protein
VGKINGFYLIYLMGIHKLYRLIYHIIMEGNGLLMLLILIQNNLILLSYHKYNQNKIINIQQIQKINGNGQIF